jgi:RNA polymerase sigma-70 factor (ECF subfamily)
VEHPRALLLTIARHLASDRTDARTRASRCAQELAVFGGIGIEFSNQSTGVLAKELILGLPQPLRDVFVLSRFAGLTNVQIGERLGISPKTVEWRMTKALAHCAAQLRR